MRLSTLILFAGAFAIRVAVTSQLSSTPLFRTPELDYREYWTWAERIAAGNFAWPVPPAHGPGYPYFLAALLALLGGSAAAARLVQAALGAALCVVVARIGERAFGRAAGLVAGGLLAVCGPLVLTEVSILSEGLLVLLLALAFLAIGGDGPLARRTVTAGVLLGLAAIVRPTALVFLPPLAVWLAATSRPLRRGLEASALFALACAVPILPVAAANARASDHPVLIQGHGGMNFYIGNAPSGTGLATVRPGEAWDLLESEPLRAGRHGPSEADAYFYGRAFREIGAAPWRWLRLLAGKAIWTLQAEEIRDTFSYAFFRSESPLLGVLPGFGLLIPLAAAGLVATALLRRTPSLLLVWLAAAYATCVVLVVGTRYRLPLAPAAALFGGAGVSLLLSRRGLGPRQRAAAAAALLAGAVVAHLRTHPPSRVFAEEWSATGTSLNHEGKPAEAVAAFERAIALDPRSADPRVGRGAALMNIGRLEEGRQELERAAALEPGSRTAQVELGIALERENRLAEAEPHYRAVLALDPEDLATRKTLGENLLRRGRAADAMAELSAVVAKAPSDVSTRLWLARALGALGRPADALAQAREAARLDPASAEAWLAATMHAMASGNLAEAETDLERAERAGSPGRDTTMARAILFRAERRLDKADGALRPLVRADPAFRPAVELFLQNARDRGAEREALDFLRRASQPNS